MRIFLLALSASLALFISPTLGGDAVHGGAQCFPPPHSCCPPPIAGCPDDYCRKPLPCITCLSPCGTCDDYCRKPIPCVPCLPCCGLCDDYCRKPLPCFCWPTLDSLRCVKSCDKCCDPKH
jgi:hypothetical protein